METDLQPAGELPSCLSPDATDQFAAALEHAALTHLDDLAGLLEAVSDCVATARANSIPPETVIVGLKRRLERGAMQHLPQREYAVLVDRVVKRIIDDYFPLS